MLNPETNVGGLYLGNDSYRSRNSSYTTQLFTKLKFRHSCFIGCRASDFFQDWWAEVNHGAKHGGSFSEMMGPCKLTAIFQ